MATPMWIRTMLHLRGVPYEELTHIEAFTAQEVAEHEHVSGHRVAKVVVALADGRPVELILPATRRVAFDSLRQMLGAQEVRLATEQEMAALFPGCEPGGPALRHWPGVEVLMDVALDVEGDILFQAGTHRDAVRLDFEDWYRVVNPRVGAFTEPAGTARRDEVLA